MSIVIIKPLDSVLPVAKQDLRQEESPHQLSDYNIVAEYTQKKIRYNIP